MACPLFAGRRKNFGVTLVLALVNGPEALFHSPLRMHPQSDMPIWSPWKPYFLPGLVCAVIAIGAVIYFNRADSGLAPPATSVVNRPVFGPGTLNEALPIDSLNKQSAPSGLNPPTELSIAGDGKLQVNPALHELIDYFLLRQADVRRTSELESYLKSRLPSPAYSEAMQIVDHYQSYMLAHDSLLASQNLGNLDPVSALPKVDRLSVWREQRDRLRLGILGEQVVSGWYADDDNRFAQSLDVLRQREGGTAAAEPTPTSAEQENQQIRESIANETKSFSTRHQEQTRWAFQFQAYLAAAAQIKSESKLSYAERDRKIQNLLDKLFASDAEKQRARDMAP